MTPNEEQPPKGHRNDHPDTEPTLLGEVLSLPPRMASRTIAQIQASQQILSLLNCAGAAARKSDMADTAGEGQPMSEPVDVIGVLGDQADDRSTDPTASEPGGSRRASPGAPQGKHDPVPETSEAPAPGPEVPAAPDAADLVIPGYDSLAASQVVPRLTTLSPDELGAIGSYEQANRGRRTILNRVKQLLASANGGS
jgi:hypothetical protein